MVPPSEPLDLPALAALMYRADWTTLSLSATVTAWTSHESDPLGSETSYRVLVAPGGKYLISRACDPDRVLEVGDGDWTWVIVPGDRGEPGQHGESRAVRRPAAGPGSPFEDVLLPARLLSRYTLDLTGTGVAAGRSAYQLTAWPRLVGTSQPQGRPDLAGALADADLGILLRYEEVRGGQPVKRTEVVDIHLGPAEVADPARFRPPPGLPVTEAEVPFRSPGVSLPGRPGDAVRAAAGVTARVMGFAVRHWPSPGRPPGEGAETMPGRDGPQAGPLEPAGDDVINLLHRTGRPPQAFTAEVHEWLDGELFTRAGARFRESLPPAVDGIFGPEALWEAMAGRAGTIYKVTRLRLAAPGRYRVDMLSGGSPADPETIACDGERQWLVRGTKVTYWDAMTLAPELSRLADPAWLLARFTLQAGGGTEVGGRHGLVVVADRGTGLKGPGWRAASATAADRVRAGRPGDGDLVDLEFGWLDATVSRVEAVVDPDLAVLLRVENFSGGRPVLCHEMRDLVRGVPDPDVFEVPAGARRSGPLEGFGLLSPGTAVKAAAGLGMAGAAGLVGWLQKRPRTPEPPPS